MTPLRRNIPLLYAFSFLQMTLFPMAIITLFWKDHIGLSLSQILLLQSLFAVAMVVMEYPSGYISDRVGYRTALTWASFIGIIGWGVYAMASSFRDVLIAEILLGISMSFISGSDSALLYESLKGTDEELSYARHQGRVSGFGQTGEAAGGGMTEPHRERLLHEGHLKQSLASARYVFRENTRLRATVLLNIVLGLATFYPVWLIQPYMQKGGVPIAWFGPVWAGANLMVALFAVLSHRIRERLSEGTMIVLLVAMTWAGYAGLGLYWGMWGFLFYFVLTAMRGMRGPFLLHVAQAEIPSPTRAGMLSLQSLCFRLVFALTGPLIGRHADAFGVGRTFQLLLAAYVIILPPLVCLFVKGSRRRSADGQGESAPPP